LAIVHHQFAPRTTVLAIRCHLIKGCGKTTIQHSLPAPHDSSPQQDCLLIAIRTFFDWWHASDISDGQAGIQQHSFRAALTDGVGD
jgi:hypothetical protein